MLYLPTKNSIYVRHTRVVPWFTIISKYTETYVIAGQCIAIAYPKTMIKYKGGTLW